MHSTKEQLDLIKVRAARLERKERMRRVVAPVGLVMLVAFVCVLMVLPALRQTDLPQETTVLGAYGSLVIVSGHMDIALAAILVVLVVSYVALACIRGRRNQR